MAFGGVAAPDVPGVTGAVVGTCRVGGLTLAARVGAPDATGAAADSGVFTTGTPTANQNQLPATFGPGAGNWVAGQDAHVQVTGLENDPDGPAAAAGGSFAHLFSKSISGGNLVVVVHNKGSVATGALDIGFIFQ